LDHPGPHSYEERLARTDPYAARLAASLPKRSPRSRAVSVATLLEIGWARNGPPPPYVDAALAMVPGVLRDLPIELQSLLVANRWRKIKGPTMTPALRDLYDDPRTTPDMRTAALSRLSELDPAWARARILAHLRSGAPPLGVLASATLGALPERTLP